MKFTADRPFAKPEAAARKLLEIVLSADINVGQHAYTGATNTAFLRASGSVAEYAAGRDYAIRKAGSRSTVPALGSSRCRPVRTFKALGGIRPAISRHHHLRLVPNNCRSFVRSTIMDGNGDPTWRALL